ncbi:sensor histidine kinase [Alkalicoccus urumqiensis]|uniref:histidine kinase n=1 Tax=Alkalicoccus urumqiensis TaxID=1548213 RepID=A0A2P6MJU8_ALKUR|nr:histidine kinase [Alkalicoccus urumqiensis]PRO66554.1 hypothetical protein C6I21_04210 [Alkalicoccus urumqiensis]
MGQRKAWFFWSAMVLVLVSWLLILIEGRGPGNAGVLLMAALYFGIYFVQPLLHRPLFQSALLSIAAVLPLAAYQDVPGAPGWMAAALTVAACAWYAPGWYVWMPGAAAAVSLLFLGAPTAVTLLSAAALTLGLWLWHTAEAARQKAWEEREALFSEYRKLKRRVIDAEKAARQEERTQIAREMHDSVGHQLTALMMQLEVAAMKAPADMRTVFTGLKELASDSLAETRRAVQKLNENDEGGMAAVMQLLRRVEAESLIRVTFTVGPGVMTAPLRPAQTAAVYRVIQESLTNAMRHGSRREVDVTLECPGGAALRLAVSNPSEETGVSGRGYGLTSMRSRVEQTGGSFQTDKSGSRFTVRAVFPLLETSVEKEESDDTHSTR